MCVWEFFFKSSGWKIFHFVSFIFHTSYKLQIQWDMDMNYGDIFFGAKKQNKTKHDHQLNWWSFYIDWISFIFIFPIYYYLTLSTNLHTVNMLNVCIFREYFQYKFPHSRRYFHFIKIVFLNWTFSLLFLFRFCFVLFCLLCNVCVQTKLEMRNARLMIK